MSRRLVLKNGAIDSECNHDFIFLGTHPSFAKGYICFDCHRHVGDVDLTKYAGLLAFVRTARLRNHGAAPKPEGK